MEDQGYWDGNEDREEMGDSDLNTYIRVNRSDIPLTPGDNLMSVVKSTARDAGLGKFRVFLNGEEIRPSEAPDQITEGMHLETRPFDVAGK